MNNLGPVWLSLFQMFLAWTSILIFLHLTILFLTGLMLNLKLVLHAKTTDEMDSLLGKLLKDTEDTYPSFNIYLQNILEYQDRWSSSARKYCLTRGNNTNNYVESRFLVVKDLILNRIKGVRLIRYLNFCIVFNQLALPPPCCPFSKLVK